ncbi:MAG: alpha-E domain-containing protein [Oleiphilaceae bacterium]|nr:alpha-E domain-containing protein [Oleiphilaceae bacterium]
MLSRVAENIYWMARYQERIEDTARLITTMTNLLLDLPRNAEVEWHELIKVVGSDKPFAELYENKSDEHSVMRFLISDRRHAGSLVNCIKLARENARVTRDILPLEFWEQLNQLHIYAADNVKGQIGRRKRNDVLSTMIRSCQGMTGVVLAALPHDDAYQFLRIGRNLERADMSSRILDVAAAQLLAEEDEFNPAFANLRWINVLKSLNAFQGYRQQGRVGVQGVYVVDYLLHNEAFPRSIRHCLLELEACFGKVPKPEKANKQLKKMKLQLDRISKKHLKRSELHAFVDDLQLELGELHTQITETYFSYI